MNFSANSSDSPPTGTVTFLFTDIEGSSGLAQKYPEQINRLLDRHNTILREAIEAQHGFIFNVIGDAFTSAFHTSREAILAAIEAQRKLLKQAWDPAPIQVRMGIHTGSARVELAEDGSVNYEGYLTLTRVQRVMSAAHGGQILLSNTSAELVREQPIDDATLRDMGKHRLKGLSYPEHLWQLVVSGLPAEFPPIQTAEVTPNNLPAQPTSLIGRKTELSEIIGRLSSSEVRLLTLTGPGGIGKTRIGLQAAGELASAFQDGVYLIDLTQIRDPEEVPAAIAQAIGLRQISDRLLDEIIEQLRFKKMLLLLDNFEQITAAAPVVVEILRACPQLKFLITSREALHVRGEYVYPLPPLALPNIEQKHPSLEQLTQYDAVRLFIERAQAVRPDFQVTNENAPAVAEICWRLDGLPLAIELATARLKLFTPQALLERLDSRLKMLRGGARDLPVRQQTLRDAIDWSYELLDSDEQGLFELLAVFTGGCSFEAVEAVAAQSGDLAEKEIDILDMLSSLVDKSLIRQMDQESGEPRFQMLETIREYAEERLEEKPGFQAAVRQVHASYYANFTQSQWKSLMSNGRELTLVVLATDIDNIRSTWSYWVNERDLQQLNKMADSLWFLYDSKGWYYAAVDLTKDLLNILESTPQTPELTQQEILLQTSLARALLAIKGYTPEVEAAYQRAMELSEKAGEIPQLMPVYRGLSHIYTYLGKFDKGVEMGEKIIGLAERQTDPNLRIEGELVYGYNLGFNKDLHLGLDHIEKAVQSIDPNRRSTSRFRLGNDPWVTSYTTSAMFWWLFGFADKAIQRANQGIDMANRLKHPYSLAYALFHASFLHMFRGEPELVQQRSREVLDIAEEHDFQVWKAAATCMHGTALARMSQIEAGLEQIRQGMHLYQLLKTPPVFWTLLLYIRAVVSGMAGKAEEGLDLLNEAMGLASHYTSQSLQPEFMRLYGVLLFQASPAKAAEAEGWLAQALPLAHALGALSIELRVANKLSEMWIDQGKRKEAQNLLSSVYDRFQEGFSTADLREAKNILGSIEIESRGKDR